MDKDTRQQDQLVNEEFEETPMDNQEGAGSPAEAADLCDGCCDARDDSVSEDKDAKQNEKTMAELEAEIESLKLKLNEAEQQRDEYLSLAQRVQADFDNYRKRNRNAIADSYANATCDVVGHFLPVLDNIDRALESFKGAQAHESLIKGVEMVQKQFLSTLEKLGVKEIEALGRPFDPELHEAVMQAEAQEGQEPNTVIEVLQKGYRTEDKIIRYSMVKVAK
ncbi:MAG TPA: nucleotide exchange factor GrpE [Candidatus Atribacteria bacterium]|nr:nucleotide exchange factor GrpE [Candidatus Atribacteria bacterium]HPT78871.1 nucleotide exchange factor GrpE [Candidatus Atribacteria bacterium]